MDFLFKFIFILIIAFVTKSYYAVVMPVLASEIVCLCLFILMLVQLISGRLDLTVIMRGGAAMMTWPVGAIIYPYIASSVGMTSTHEEARAFAPIIAGAAGMFAYSVADKRDHVRDQVTITLGLITLYTVISVAATADVTLLARFLSYASFSLCVYMTREMMILPPDQVKYFTFLMGIPSVSFLGKTKRYLFPKGNPNKLKPTNDLKKA